MSEISSIKDICKICLSSGRKMYTIKSFVINLLTSCDVELNTDDNICWECNAMLTKFFKFQQKAIRASALLEEYSKAQIRLETLSNLSINKCYNINYPNDEQKSQTKSNKRKQREEQEEKEEKEIIRDNHIKLETEDFDFDNEITIECELIKEETCTNDLTLMTKRKKHKKDIKLEDKKGIEDRDETKKYVEMELNHNEMLELRESSLNNLVKGNIRFKCDKCLLGFKTESKLNKHNYSAHVKSHVRDVLCTICECFVRDKYIDSHLKSHYLAYKCVKCEHYFKNRSLVRNHYYSEHVYKGAVTCRICKRRFEDQVMLVNHKKMCHEPVECDVCSKKLSDKQSLKSHMLLHAEGTPMFQCDICFKYYRGRSGLRIHMAGVHQTKKPENAYCAECDIHYRSIHTYKLHLMQSARHTGLANRLKCDQCGKTFISKQYLSKHIQIIHNKISKYICTDCDKRFVGPKKLQNHINFVHNKLPKPRIFDCSVCHKKFSSKQVLKNHMNSHTGHRPYNCEMCDATFTQSGSLYKHKQLVHKIKKLSD